jgi:hypothetical protein
MIMFVMVGAGYDPQGVADWSGKFERPSVYSTSFFSPHANPEQEGNTDVPQKSKR